MNYAQIEKTPNTAENRIALRREGMFAYNVWYWDTNANKEKCVGAKWNNKTGDFEYCAGRFAFKSDIPRLEQVPGALRYNPITYWAKCSDMQDVEP